MNVNPLVSVIIPIYKVEPYLRQCVDSVICQSYKNLEIILVDDGSPDNCPKICDEYAQQDSRVKVIHKPNGGLSDARNAGIEIATGEYLSFVDSDDLIHIRMIEILMKPLIENKDLKMSVCQSLKFYDCDIIDINQAIRPTEIVDYRFFLTKNLWATAWCKIYQRKLFKDIRYPVGRIHEDEFTTYKIYYEAKKFAYTDSQLHFYRQREGSIMDSMTIKRLVDVHDALKGQVEFFWEKNEYLMYSNFLSRFVLFYSKNIRYEKVIIGSDNLFKLWKTEIKRYPIRQLSFKQKAQYYLGYILPRVSFFLKECYNRI